MVEMPEPFGNKAAANETTGSNPHTIAVLIPCFNEEPTIAKVIVDFQTELPGAQICVFDNNSSDRTVEFARQSGATIFRERRQGKGFVVQSMFREVDADIYIMVDGDGTYPASDVKRLLEPVLSNDADMVVGSRLSPSSRSQFRPLNRLGNQLFLFITKKLFNVRINDMLSGYRVFNREIVKQLPLLSAGFEIETELTIKALERGYRIIELPVNLAMRPQGSHSKIRHLQDGMLIMGTIFSLARDYKPFTIFGSIGLFLVALGLIPGTIVILEFARTGLVPRLPSAVLAVGMVLSGIIMGVVGLVLHTVARRFQELNLQLRLLERESRRPI